MIHVSLQRGLIQAQQFLRFMQRKAPDGDERNEFSLSRNAQLRVFDMAPDHVEVRLCAGRSGHSER